jgi:hypothetical protein
MTGTIHKLRWPTSSAGGPPDDPMLEQRVDRLERMPAALEPKITEILLTGAKSSDVGKVQIDIAELKGRFEAVKEKVSALPSTFTILTIVFTTWALGSGILIFALNLLRR